MISRLACMPNFFVLGAAKAGTTTLYDLLKLHPQVYLPYDKEPMFFSRDDYFERGTDWYRKTFFQGSERFARRGEASPHYLYWARKVSERLRLEYGDQPVRLIVILRDPVQRAYSWYQNMVQEGEERLTFLAALQAEEQRLQTHNAELESHGWMRFGYCRGGRYASQLREYLAHFPRESLHILLLEDLQRDAAGTLRQLCEFLQIDPGFVFRSAQRNPAAVPRSRALQRLVRAPSRLKTLAKPWLAASLRYRLKRFVRGLNQKETAYAEMEPAAAEYLRARLQVEVVDLAGIMQRDLSHWS
jgi:hypothetical protein